MKTRDEIHLAIAMLTIIQESIAAVRSGEGEGFGE